MVQDILVELRELGPKLRSFVVEDRVENRREGVAEEGLLLRAKFKKQAA